MIQTENPPLPIRVDEHLTCSISAPPLLDAANHLTADAWAAHDALDTIRRR